MSVLLHSSFLVQCSIFAVRHRRFPGNEKGLGVTERVILAGWGGQGMISLGKLGHTFYGAEAL